MSNRDKSKDGGKNQTRLDSFYGISKDPNYISMASMRPDKGKDTPTGKQNPPKPSHQPSTFLPTSFQSSNYSRPSNSRTDINLEDCVTYALPHHIPKIWKVAKPKLIEIREGKIQNVFSFVEVMHDFIQSHYTNQLRNLNLSTLTNLIENVFNEDEIKNFFTKILPFMAKLALEVESLFREPLYILKQNTSSTVSLTKRQVACLLTHMFFCTLHKQNNSHLRSDCNFTNLFRESRRGGTKLEKLKCLYNYFKKISLSLPDENITFERLTLKIGLHGKVNLDYWMNSNKSLKRCVLKDVGGIEDEKNAIQVDFANMNIGGGVLDHGCVQEEIRFMVSPELMVSMLITETLQDHEAVLMTGTEKYSGYTGYSNTFKYASFKKEDLKLDNFMRRDSMVLAIDAVDYAKTSSHKIQFKKERILRELNKAYLGFFGSPTEESDTRKAIATGRWGCGAFQGNSQLKFIIQWLAASQANRDMIFYRFEDTDLKAAERVVNKFKDSTVRELYEALNSYNALIFNEGGMTLFEFLLNVD